MANPKPVSRLGRPDKIREIENLSKESRGRNCSHLAAMHAVLCIETLAKIVRRGRNDGYRIAAAKELLDRGFGRPKQEVDIDAPNGPIQVIGQLMLVDARDGRPLEMKDTPSDKQLEGKIRRSQIPGVPVVEILPNGETL